MSYVNSSPWSLIGAIVLGSCGGHPLIAERDPADAGGGPSLPRADAAAADAAFSEGFVKVQGDRIVLGNEPYRMRGITFSSNYFASSGAWITNPSLNLDHSADDFSRVAELGMNVVQLILSYRAFEDDTNPFTYLDSGWKWLDDNIQAANKNGLRVVLDMLMVPGGNWHTVPPVSFELWTNDTLRKRYVALWRALAARYANEPAVMAFSLLNEPVTLDADGASWWDLANETIAEIRSVDTVHPVIVNPIAGVAGAYGFPANIAEYRLVNDNNAIYDVHFYEPSEFVNQGASWVANAPLVGQTYPDTTHPTVVGNLEYVEGDTNNPVLPPGSSDWQSLTGVPYVVDSEEAAVSYPAVICSNMTATGKAYFDDFEIDETTTDGTLIRTILDGSAGGTWSPYSVDVAGNTGTCGGACRTEAGSGRQGGDALAVSGDFTTALLSTWSYLFVVTPGHTYRISGWAKGTNLDSASQCRFTLGFYKPSPGSTISVLDRSYLHDHLSRRLSFGLEHGVPMAVTEFGAMRVCFQQNLGGVNWLQDMVAELDLQQANYVYFTYHNASMGIYGDESQLPNPGTEIAAIPDFFRGELADAGAR